MPRHARREMLNQPHVSFCAKNMLHQMESGSTVPMIAAHTCMSQVIMCQEDLLMLDPIFTLCNILVAANCHARGEKSRRASEELHKQ